LGKGRWWWIFDDSLLAITKSLQTTGFVYLDSFLDAASTANLHADVRRAWVGGALKEKGGLTDAREGKNTNYSRDETRGDFLGWFNGSEEGMWTQEKSLIGSTSAAAPPDSLSGYILKVSTLLEELKPLLPLELGDVCERSRAMVTCYPPNAHYSKHVDNGGSLSNGRRLTTLLYLNVDWVEGDGGELALYDPTDISRRVKTIEPLGGRCVLLWSDRRVPHEVLEAHKDRFTITIWFFSARELAEAKRLGVHPEDLDQDNKVKEGVGEK